MRLTNTLSVMLAMGVTLCTANAQPVLNGDSEAFGPALCNDPAADVDADGDVDHDDFTFFQACYSGPMDLASLEPAYCACLDGDVDGDIDQDDLVLLEICFSGPGIPADPSCDVWLPASGLRGRENNTTEPTGSLSTRKASAADDRTGATTAGGEPRLQNGGSLVAYELELGGDNHAEGWTLLSPPLPPAFTPGSTEEGQVYALGDVVTWDAVVEVSGLHSADGFVPNGAASMVFSLALHEVDCTGPLVTDVEWFSSIDDGVRQSWLGPHPMGNGSFCVSYDISQQGPPIARVIDPCSSFGPYMGFYTYPSSAVHPQWATVEPGRLEGMGAGYREFQASGYPYLPGCFQGNSSTTAGVGMDVTGAGVPGLGVVPVFEGQINTCALSAGTYCLELIPHPSNILLGSFDPADPFGSPGDFADFADAVQGDTITFELAEPALQVVEWRSVRTHGVGDADEADVGLVFDHCGLCADTEPRIGGIRRIEIDFNQPVTLAGGSAQAAVISGDPLAPGYPADGMSLANGNATLVLTFNPGTLPDGRCYEVDLREVVDGLEGNTTCRLTALEGDVDGDGNVSLADALLAKDDNGATGVSRPRSDIDLNNDVQLADALLAFDRNGMQIQSPSCP